MDINLTDYTAFGSFAPVYTWVKRELLSEKDKVTLLVLDVCAQHANHLGAFYCGPKRLAEISCYGYGTVKRSLNKILENDWIRISNDPDQFGMKKKVYVFSPYVLWISRDYISDAIALFSSLSQFNEMCNAQPENPESETRLKIQNQKPSGETTTSALKGVNKPVTTHPDAWQNEGADKSADFESENDDDQIQRNALSQRTAPKPEARSAAGTDKKGSAAPPRSLAKFWEPLGEHHHEELAQRIAALGTTISQARELVARHSYEVVSAGVAWATLGTDATGRPILNKVGYLVAGLERQQFAPNDLPENDWERQAKLWGVDS